MGVHIFTKTKNTDHWKDKKKISVNLFQKILILHTCLSQKMLNVSSEHSFKAKLLVKRKNLHSNQF